MLSIRKQRRSVPMKETKNEIVVYQPNETIRLDVRLENENIWLNRHQIAQLFSRDIKTIGKHITNALNEELSENLMADGKYTAVVAKFATTAVDGKTYQVEYYNLDVVLSVGYRVKSPQGILFRHWANTVLKEYLLRGYVYNQRFNQLQDTMDRRFAKQENDIAKLKRKVDYFVQTSLPPVQGVFFDGQVFDARAFATKHILNAQKSIFLIDSWVDIATLELLAKKEQQVSVEIITSHKGNKLSTSDISAFNSQYGGLSVRENNCFHDRFLIIDDSSLYLIGASLKDLGKKCFAFTKLDLREIPRLKARTQTS